MAFNSLAISPMEYKRFMQYKTIFPKFLAYCVIESPFKCIIFMDMPTIHF